MRPEPETTRPSPNEYDAISPATSLLALMIMLGVLLVGAAGLAFTGLQRERLPDESSAAAAMLQADESTALPVYCTHRTECADSDYAPEALPEGAH